MISGLFNYTTCTVVAGTLCMGITCGVLGCFAFLRRQSLLADALSHAALPGIAAMFLCTYSKHSFILLIGGGISGAIGTALIGAITNYTTLKRDAALGIILSVFFGLGLVLLTVIQKRPVATQSALNKFLFGNAATLLTEELFFIVLICIGILCTVVCLWKQFCLITFDHRYAHTLGYPVARLNTVLTGLLLLSILVSLQTVGVILSSTMFIAPAVAARQWADRLSTMVCLAGFFGGASCVVGTLISSRVCQLPTGPTIVVVMSSITFASLVMVMYWPRVVRVVKQAS